MALTSVRHLYTIRKNSLSRLLDPIPELLQDQSVGTERLVETRKGCKVAWDQFALARDALVEVPWLAKVGSRGSAATCK